MFFSNLLRTVFVSTLLTVFCLHGPSQSAHADPEVDIDIWVGSVVGQPGDSGLEIPVYLTNHTDTVSAFELQFQMDDPSVATFTADLDTVGTLLSGWQYLSCRVLTLDEEEFLRLTAIANIDSGSCVPGFGPQSGEVPLARLSVSLANLPVPTVDSVEINVSYIPPIEFEPPWPDTSEYDSCAWVMDTAYYRCNFWVPPDTCQCLDWSRVYEPPYDSLHTDSTFQCWGDSLVVHTTPGYIRILFPVCGNIDGSLDGLVTMGDLTLLIDHLFISLEPLRWPSIGNVDGSSDDLVTMGDLTKLIDHLFISLDDLECPMNGVM